MSKGEIIKPKGDNLPDNLMSRPMHDVIYEVIQTCEVEVDDSHWKYGDELILEKVENITSHISSLENKLGSTEGSVSDEIELLKQEITDIKNRKPREIAVSINQGDVKELGLQHYQFETLLTILSTKLNAYIVGPAGSGKTTAAVNCATALGVKFYFTGAIASEFKLTGFIDAKGNIVSTEFRKAYEEGGLFLFDEIDASYPQAVLAFNAALANDYMDFPDQRVTKHEDFYCIAAANTFGQGADRQYVGRNQLDAASLDRFVFLAWNYDENLERELAGHDEWVDVVQDVRRVIEDLKIRHVVSPRASIYGARLLSTELGWDKVVEILIWKGLDVATINKIRQNLKVEIDAE